MHFFLIIFVDFQGKEERKMVMPWKGKEGLLKSGNPKAHKNHNRIPPRGSPAVPMLVSRDTVEAQGSCSHRLMPEN